MRTVTRSTLLFLLLMAAAECKGEPAGAPDEAAVARVLAGMKEARNQVRTGVFRASGVHSQTGTEVGDLRDDMDVYCAFDRPNNKTRFDRSLPKRMRLTPEQMEEQKTSEPIVVVERKTKVILTPTEVLWKEGSESLRESRPDQKAAPWDRDQPFDDRCLGLYFWLGFQKGLRFERLHKEITDLKPSTVERDPDGRWKIVWELADPVRSRMTLWVDEPRGFTVTRSETRYARKKGEAWVWQEPSEKSEVTWANEQGVWLPKTFVIQTLSEARTDAFELAFDWESVNQPVPEVVFTREGLVSKDNTGAHERTAGLQPAVTEAQKDNPTHSAQDEKPEASSEAPEHAPGSTENKVSPYLWVALIGVLAVVALAAFGLYRRSTRGSQRQPSQ